MPLSKPDIDTLMVDWLYGELGPDEASRFEEQLANDPEAMAEAQALKQTRAAFRDLDDEEPSSALSAILMHEAAIAAPKKGASASEAGGGLWAAITGFFAPIAMHPAASAMATLVVVAGVAGTLYLRKGNIVSEPTTASTTTTAALERSRPGIVAPAPAAAVDGVGDDSAFGNLKAGKAEGFPVDLLQEENAEPESESEVVTRGPADERLERFDEVTKKQSPAKASRRKSRVRGMDSAIQLKPKTKTKPPEAFASQIANVVSGADSSADDALAASPVLEDKETEGDRLQGRKGKADYRAYKDEPSGGVQSKKPLRWVEQQQLQLTVASQKKRCRDAGRIANDILDRDPKYYTKRVKNSQEETDCRWDIANETKRRVKNRAKKTARQSKKKQRKGKGQSVPQKAKAAPQPNEAQGL